MAITCLALAAACSRRETRPEGAAASPASASASARPDASAAASASTSASALAPRPVTDAERAAQRRYVAALALGRKSTVAKDYAAAVKAFDDALAAKQGDARALAERGYARLLEGRELDLAERDLDEAARATTDKKLLAQIWFNRGLALEKRARADNALAAFRTSNTLAPTAAAQQKIAGQQVCPVQVARDWSPASAAGGPVVATGWLTLLRALPSTEEDKTEAKTDADARRTLTHANVDPELPTVVVAGSAGTGTTAWLVARAPMGMRAFPIGAEWGGRCPGELTFEVQAKHGDVVHVHGRETVESGYSFMCQAVDAGEEIRPCAQMPDDAVRVQSYCAGGSPVLRDLFIDVVKGKVLLALEQPDGDVPTIVTGGATQVWLTGAGCSRVLELH